MDSNNVHASVLTDTLDGVQQYFAALIRRRWQYKVCFSDRIRFDRFLIGCFGGVDATGWPHFMLHLSGRQINRWRMNALDL